MMRPACSASLCRGSVGHIDQTMLAFRDGRVKVRGGPGVPSGPTADWRRSGLATVDASCRATVVTGMA